MGQNYASKYIPSFLHIIISKEGSMHDINSLQVGSFPVSGIILDNPFNDPKTIVSQTGILSYSLGLTDKYET